MDQRKMMLPDGWYPHSYGSAEKQLIRWKAVDHSCKITASAGIAPHAGWDFSGQIAWNVIKSIPLECDLIIIAGGHLSAAAEFKVLDYQRIETPFGALKVDKKLQSILCRGFQSDWDPDNSIEIMLPMIKYRFPDIPILPVRLSPTKQSIEWGRRVAQYCSEKGLNAFFLGSTDLSHYGTRFANSGFGTGKKARNIVREKDYTYLKLLADLKAEDSIQYAREEKTACSSGAAAASLGFILESGNFLGKICEHKYSYEIFDSGADFVGYGSVLFQ